jgi:hypothetical protein
MKNSGIPEQCQVRLSIQLSFKVLYGYIYFVNLQTQTDLDFVELHGLLCIIVAINQHHQNDIRPVEVISKQDINQLPSSKTTYRKRCTQETRTR